MKIERIDHIVLTVQDVERTRRFYEQAFDMDALHYEDGRHALQFGDQMIKLHQAGQEHDPHAGQPTPGSADFCLVTNQSLQEVRTHLHALGIALESDNFVRRQGAAGPIESLYLRDPDGNLIEVAHYHNRVVHEAE